MEESKKRDRILGIVVGNGSILLIKRITPEETFYGFPGGGREEGETLEQTVIREIKEETNVDARNPEFLFHIDHPKFGRTHFFLVTDFDANELMMTGGQEPQEASETNQYIPYWLPLSEFETATVYPAVAVPMVADALRQRNLLSTS
jgi:8-oxo-dGTP diphosphatase